ncbi:MAG: pyrimidine/purine nucleoside phosphorylase [Bacteroidales bacterium]|nr:pyrimidine/purine nucleoside phosphorylase [Bacteroidales bacterium]HNZ43959.1 pyrimidine/purine nucleoside phosphorylase [Bacteroidales bacterium]
MFKVNEYFNGKVTSLGFQAGEGKATIGVLAPGEYEFGTSTVEYMTVIYGKMDVLLPGETSWKTYNEFETFMVPKDAKFKMKTGSDTAYRCLYK